MQSEEDQTIIEILAAIPSEEKPEDEKTQVLANIPNKEIETGDDQINFSPNLVFKSNKDANINLNNFDFENFYTNYETVENSKKSKILELFLESVVNMFNKIISSYEMDLKLSRLNIKTILEKTAFKEIRFKRLLDIIVLGCPENEEIIFKVFDEEREKKLTMFEYLINFKFGEFFEYFAENCKVLVYGKHIYVLEGIFQTFDDVIKNNKEIKKNEKKEFKNFETLNKMEIDTIDLQSDSFEVINN